MEWGENMIGVRSKRVRLSNDSKLIYSLAVILIGGEGRKQSGDLFRFFLYDATNVADRSSLRAIVGEPAELLTWRFGTVARGELLNLAEAIQLDAPPPSMTSNPADLVSVSHRLDNSTTLTNADVAKILIVTIADYLEQMVETNGWCVPPRV